MKYAILSLVSLVMLILVAWNACETRDAEAVAAAVVGAFIFGALYMFGVTA